MSEKTIAEKLLLKPGRKLKLIHPPTGYLENLGELPAFAKIVSISEPADVVQLFIRSYAELEVELPKARELIQPMSIFWVSYPKQPGPIRTDIDREILIEYARLRNWKDNGMISINNTWAAMRFRTQ